VLNTPNVITILRVLFVPAYLWAIYAHFSYANQLACLFFIIAGLTDLLDGFIARKYGLVTTLGKIIDPVADKIVVYAAMVALVSLQRLSGWIVILMLFRDFSVGALRDAAAQRGTIIAAGFWGKIKTVFQMVSLGFLIFYDSLIFLPLSAFGLYPGDDRLSIPADYTATPTFLIGMVLMYIALAASIFSCVIYFKQYYKIIINGEQ
jgi:CDP-diacylglycerol--glycerol-3-phosphate 3-phosphatidyltransferase/cardiolipin synthase